MLRKTISFFSFCCLLQVPVSAAALLLGATGDTDFSRESCSEDHGGMPRREEVGVLYWMTAGIKETIPLKWTTSIDVSYLDLGIEKNGVIGSWGTSTPQSAINWVQSIDSNDLRSNAILLHTLAENLWKENREGVIRSDSHDRPTDSLPDREGSDADETDSGRPSFRQSGSTFIVIRPSFPIAENSAVPESSSLLLGGLAALGFLRRHRPSTL